MKKKAASHALIEVRKARRTLETNIEEAFGQFANDDVVKELAERIGIEDADSLTSRLKEEVNARIVEFLQSFGRNAPGAPNKPAVLDKGGILQTEKTKAHRRVVGGTETPAIERVDKEKIARADLVRRLEELELAAHEVCPEIIPGLRRALLIVKGRPPQWGDPKLPDNLKVLTAPLYFKHFYTDLIVDGVVDTSLVREFDSGLMAGIDQYIFTRTKRKQDAGDAAGLHFVTGRAAKKSGARSEAATVEPGPRGAGAAEPRPGSPSGTKKLKLE